MRNLYKCAALLMGLFIISCTTKQEVINGEKYSTLVNYSDDFKYHNPEREQRRTDRYLSRDTLYIFFETDFESDTVKIKVNGKPYKTIYLTTDEAVGVADMVQHGAIRTIKEIEIVKNNGVPLTFELTDKTMNLWTVNFYKDTLRAERKKYLPWYE